MQVEGQQEGSLLSLLATGEWVSNAYPTFREVRNSLAKVRLMPYVVFRRHLKNTKDSSLRDGDASD